MLEEFGDRTDNGRETNLENTNKTAIPQRGSALENSFTEYKYCRSHGYQQVGAIQLETPNAVLPFDFAQSGTAFGVSNFSTPTD